MSPFAQWLGARLIAKTLFAMQGTVFAVATIQLISRDETGGILAVALLFTILNIIGFVSLFEKE